MYVGPTPTMCNASSTPERAADYTKGCTRKEDVTVKRETVEEYLRRGKQITQCESGVAEGSVLVFLHRKGAILEEGCRWVSHADTNMQSRQIVSTRDLIRSERYLRGERKGRTTSKRSPNR